MKKKILLPLLLFSVCLAVGLAGCNKKKAENKPTEIAYDGEVITWNKVELADHYTVAINDGEAKRVNTNSFAYNAGGEAFDVTVSAVIGEKSFGTSMHFTPLATIEEVTVSEKGALSWAAIEGATAYVVRDNGVVLGEVTDTAYDLPAGAHRVQVRAVVSGDGSYYSKWSEEKSLTVLAAPSEIAYREGELRWLGNAASYSVTLNGTAQTVAGNSLRYDPQNLDFTVEITAVGDHAQTYDSATVREVFRYLAQVRELNVADGALQWEGVENAEGYKLKIDGHEQAENISGTAYEKLPTGRSLTLQVLPYNTNGNWYSQWSGELTAYILDTPQVQWLNDAGLDGEVQESVLWNAVNAAAGYTVRVRKDGGAPEINTYSQDRLSFSHAYREAGVYTVEVKANAQSGGADHYDSRYCAPVTVERLAAPQAETQVVTSTRDNLAAGFTVHYKSVTRASGYQLYKDGALQAGRVSTGTSITETAPVENSNIAAQNIINAVQSLGSPARTVNGAISVVLSCLTENMLSVPVTVQATPQSPQMSGYTLSWTGSSENGYTVAYAGNSFTAQNANYDLSVMKAGTYPVTVSARGDGASVLASTPSAPVTVQRLTAPADLRIRQEGNGRLEFTHTANASGFSVYANLEQSALTANALDNMYDRIATSGTTLSIVADANYYNNDNTVYYMSSERSAPKQFIRLAAPTFPESALQSMSKLQWRAPENVNAREWTKSYKVYTSRGVEAANGVASSEAFDLSHLAAGEHTFMVVAVGDGDKYVTSDYSEPIRFQKLAAPVLRVQNGRYEWDSVAGASAYYLEIDGAKAAGEWNGTGGKFAYKPRYTASGDHIVRLKAVGDGRTSIDGAYCAYTQKTAVLPAPAIRCFYTADGTTAAHTVTAGGKIRVEVTSPVANAAEYLYEVGDGAQRETATAHERIMQSTGTFAVRVKAIGGTFDANDVYYIDSPYTGGTTITLLAAPALNEFSVTIDGAIRWGANRDAVAFEYKLSFDNGAYGDTVRTPNAVAQIENYRNYRTIKIRVRACGNSESGGNTVSSGMTEYIWTNNL